MYDIIIKNGRIIDGSGMPAYLSDLAIQSGKIARIGKGLVGGEGTRIIDAGGLVVTPGFIDSHSHADSAVLTYPDQIEKVEQGITTSVAGQCGSSPAPISRDISPDSTATIGDFGRRVEIMRTMGSFLSVAKDVPQGANIAILVGHGNLRKAVMGMENREPTAEELEKMKALLREGLEAGALGLSFGLIYPPSCYAQTDELIELAKVVGEYHAVVAAHIRNESESLIKSVDEFIRVIRESGTRGVISHHKAAGRENWGKVNATLRLIDEACAEGVDLFCDVYPYIASSTSLSSRFIPKECCSGGNAGIVKLLSDPIERQKIKERNIRTRGWDQSMVLITVCSAYRQYEGKFLPEIAELHGKDVHETALDLICDSKNNVRACYFTMCEADVETVLAHPRAMVGTDSGVQGTMNCYHPRLRGTYPRVLGRYVRERDVTTLPEMIRKMTSMPAAVYELTGKGLLREGFDADICIFDPDRIIDRAEFVNCHNRAEGLNYVLVGGEVVVENAVYQEKRNGRVLLRQVDR